MVWSCAFLLILILGSAALFSWLRGNPHSYPGPSQQHFSSGDERPMTHAAFSMGHHHSSNWSSGESDSNWGSSDFDNGSWEEASESST